MKKLSFILVALFFSLTGFSQIAFESSYAYSGTFTQLANSGDKFFIMDIGLNQCRIYNTNHTIWKTLTISVPANNYLYDIQYVSENLFTTDNSLCLVYTYYSYDAVNLYYTYTTNIVKENGNMLLTLPGCQYYYATSLSDGSTKLVTYTFDYSLSPYTIETAVYDLPGTLYLSVKNNPENTTNNRLSAFPNPAADRLTLNYELPAGTTTATMFITDFQGRQIGNYPLNVNTNHFEISVGQLPKGVYLYSVQSGNYQSKIAKIIVN